MPKSGLSRESKHRLSLLLCKDETGRMGRSEFVEPLAQSELLSEIE